MAHALHKHGRFFDAWSRFYRSGPFGRELARVQRKTIERLDVRPGHRVLDLGCGPGDGALVLGRSGALPVGLDYSRGMIDHARHVDPLRGRLVRGDAGRLPFADHSFDRVLCTNSFHHYPAHLAALRDIHRVLKPGGRLGLVDPRKDHLFGWFAIDLVENALFGLDDVRIFSVPQWHRLLGEAGFRQADVRRGGGPSPVELALVFVVATA